MDKGAAPGVQTKHTRATLLTQRHPHGPQGPQISVTALRLSLYPAMYRGAPTTYSHKSAASLHSRAPLSTSTCATKDDFTLADWLLDVPGEVWKPYENPCPPARASRDVLPQLQDRDMRLVLPFETRTFRARRVELVARTRHLLSRNSQLATPYTVLHKACITVHHTDKGAAPDVQTRHTVLRIRQGRSGHQHTQETSQTLAVAPPPPQPSGARRAHASSFSTTPNSRGRSQCDQSSLQCVPKSEGMVRAAAERAG